MHVLGLIMGEMTEKTISSPLGSMAVELDLGKAEFYHKY